MTHDLRTMARALGGKVWGRDTVLVPGPGHSSSNASVVPVGDALFSNMPGQTWRHLR